MREPTNDRFNRKELVRYVFDRATRPAPVFWSCTSAATDTVQGINVMEWYVDDKGLTCHKTPRMRTEDTTKFLLVELGHLQQYLRTPNGKSGHI
jgi:hypothetical protein